MERALDVYAEPHTEDEPLVCMDEAAKQMTAGLADPVAASPGRPAKEDYHYDRRGVRAIFLFFDPVRGWRRVSGRDSRTRVDWAEEVRRLLDEDYPDARRVTLVCDNLNTHGIASLYEAFPAEEAWRLARRLRIVHTPRSGSWLNVAEIELSVLARQCLGRRIGSAAEVDAECAAWERQRNAEGSRVNWRFTTADARIKLRHLYPQF
jgi:DDE superfamily endonuclease